MKTFSYEKKIPGLLKIKLQNLRRETLALKLKTHNSEPILNFFMKTSFNATDETLTKSFERYPGTNRTSVLVGVNFLADLDFGNQKTKRNSLDVLALSNVEVETNDVRQALSEKEALIKKVNSSYLVFSSIKELGEIQLQKLNNERRLLDLGRSSIFQVLQYEQDYIFSEEALYRKMLEIKMIENQLSLYKYDLMSDL